MKFSFRGLPLFFGGNTFFVPTRVGKVAVAVAASPSRTGKTTVVTSKVTFGSSIGDYSTTDSCTLAPRFSALLVLNISRT